MTEMILPTVWTLTPDWLKPPLSLNDRGHWAVHAKKTAMVRDWACFAVTEHLIPPLRHCTVEMIWIVPDLTRRDAENPVATLKPFCDGLVDGGLVPDDVPSWMTKVMPAIEFVRGQRGLRFEISGVPA